MDAIPPSPPTAEALVRLRGLRLTVPSAAGPVNILRGIDLDLWAGETVGLVGPSGSGKTSLLMVLAGLERASAGSIRFGGREITGLDEDALARWRRDAIGIVFQAFHLIPTMTALENVAVPLELAGRRDAAARAREVLEAVGLGHRLSHLPGQLSGGEQQRAALARALAPAPALLLADEPTGNLDQETGQAVMDLLFRQAATSGATLLLVTHDPGLAGRCGRCVHFADGRVTRIEHAALAGRTAVIASEANVIASEAKQSPTLQGIASSRHASLLRGSRSSQ
jgi:putative ABC transport system ATP-binding protein